MNKTQKNVPQVKKVPPPAIPDSVACRHSGSSFGSTGYSSSSDDAFLDPNTCIKPGKINGNNCILTYNSFVWIPLDYFTYLFMKTDHIVRQICSKSFVISYPYV